MIGGKTYTHDPEYSDKNDTVTAVEHSSGDYVVLTRPTPVVYVLTRNSATGTIVISETT